MKQADGRAQQLESGERARHPFLEQAASRAQQLRLGVDRKGRRTDHLFLFAAQAKAYRAARDATDLIKEAIANGNQWKSIADLLACAEGLQRLQTSFAGVIRWVNRGSTVVLVWVIVEGSVCPHCVEWALFRLGADTFALADLRVRRSLDSLHMGTASLTRQACSIASVTLLKIINRQISQLKRTLRSAETLRNLSLAAVHDIRAPSIAFFDPSQRYLELPPLKSQHETLEEDVGVERGAGLSSAVMNEESLADVRHKLARMMTFRKVYIFSVCATGYAMFAAVAYGGE